MVFMRVLIFFHQYIFCGYSLNLLEWGKFWQWILIKYLVFFVFFFFVNADVVFYRFWVKMVFMRVLIFFHQYIFCGYSLNLLEWGKFWQWILIKYLVFFVNADVVFLLFILFYFFFFVFFVCLLGFFCCCFFFVCFLLLSFFFFFFILLLFCFFGGGRLVWAFFFFFFCFE